MIVQVGSPFRLVRTDLAVEPVDVLRSRVHVLYVLLQVSLELRLVPTLFAFEPLHVFRGRVLRLHVAAQNVLGDALEGAPIARDQIVRGRVFLLGVRGQIWLPLCFERTFVAVKPLDVFVGRVLHKDVLFQEKLPLGSIRALITVEPLDVLGPVALEHVSL